MYELNPQKRKEVMGELLQLLPPSKRNEARKTVNELADLFEGQDLNTIGVLWRAAEVNKFDDYTAKLKDYYTREGQYISVRSRRTARNYNVGLLRAIAIQEKQIAEGFRPESERRYWPQQFRELIKDLGSVKMELFFADCFEEIMKKK